jgi:CheY-like chemotaxis protein
MVENREHAYTATVLLAEDNPAEQNLARRSLHKGRIQCDLRVVSDGEEAMDYLLQRGRYADPDDAPRPELVLLDLNMPRLDGRQVLEQMKSDAALCTIPVVVLTTSRHEEDVVHSYKLGCNSFINKPLDVEEFIRVLRQLGKYWLKLVVLPGRQGR